MSSKSTELENARELARLVESHKVLYKEVGSSNARLMCDQILEHLSTEYPELTIKNKI